MKKVFCLFCILVFWGCEKVVDLQYAATPAKIVLDGYISPQGSELFITRSTPAGKEMNRDSLFLNDALAILYQDSNPIDTFINIDTLGHFELSQNTSIVVGASYQIKVFAGGLGVASVDDLLIPEPIDSLQMIFAPKTSDKGSIKVSFDAPDNSLFYVKVTGYGSMGLELPVASTFLSDVGECPATWTLPRYFCETRCLNIENPRVSFDFEYEAYNYHWKSYDDTYVYLHRIRYAISLSDKKYKNLFYVNEGFDLGFIEPKITETNVKDGYGVVLPLNMSQVEVEF